MINQARVHRNAGASGASAWIEVLNDPGMGRTSANLNASTNIK